MGEILDELKNRLPLWLMKWGRSAPQDRRTVASDGKYYELVPRELMPKPNVVGGFEIVEEKTANKKTWEAGVIDSTNPFLVHWTGKTVEAESSIAAEDLFEEQGFYRNLAVREISATVLNIAEAKNATKAENGSSDSAGINVQADVRIGQSPADDRAPGAGTGETVSGATTTVNGASDALVSTPTGSSESEQLQEQLEPISWDIEAAGSYEQPTEKVDGPAAEEPTGEKVW
jgi:hypothetical protein